MSLMNLLDNQAAKSLPNCDLAIFDIESKDILRLEYQNFAEKGKETAKV